MATELVWQAASWLLASIGGGLVVAFTYGRAVGKWQAHIEAEIEAARKSRSGIHREIENSERRLAAGDAKFDGQMVKLAEQATRLEAVAQDLRDVSSALGRFVSRELCNTKHQSVDHRLDVLEQRKR